MSVKESLTNAFNAVKEETQKQFEKTKEAIENYKPNQLEKKIADCEKAIEKYNDLLDETSIKIQEYEFKKTIAEQEKVFAEEKLKSYN